MFSVVDRVKVGDKPVWSVDMSPALDLVAVACGTKCELYTYKTGRLVHVQSLDPPHSKTIRRVSIKPAGGAEGGAESPTYPTLALASFDGTCSIFGSDTLSSPWEMLAVVEGHESEVKGLGWSFDGRYLATCGRDKAVWVWETDALNEEFECVCVLSAHEGDVKAIRWAPDAHAFVSCSYDDSFKVWRQEPGNDDQFECTASFAVGATVWDAQWTSSDEVVVGLDDGRVLKYRKVGGESGGGTVKGVEDWAQVAEWHARGAVYGLGLVGSQGEGENLLRDGPKGPLVLAVGSSGLVECENGASVAPGGETELLADVNTVAGDWPAGAPAAPAAPGNLGRLGNFLVVGTDKGTLTLVQC